MLVNKIKDFLGEINEKINIPLYLILGIIIIVFAISFIFGSAYGKGRWIKITKYCIELGIDKNEILNCMQGALDQEKEE